MYILVRVVDVLSPFNVDFSAIAETVIHKTALGKIKFRKLHVRISVQFSFLISAVVFFLRLSASIYDNKSTITVL